MITNKEKRNLFFITKGIIKKGKATSGVLEFEAQQANRENITKKYIPVFFILNRCLYFLIFKIKNINKREDMPYRIVIKNNDCARNLPSLKFSKSLT